MQDKRFNPALPFRTQDGRDVANVLVAEDGYISGQLSGFDFIWRPDGRLYDDDSPAHLVNVEPAPDAGELDLDALLRLMRNSPEEPAVVLGEVGHCTTEFYRAARKAIPLFPAYIARREAEARREALEEAIKAVWKHFGGSNELAQAIETSLRALISEPTS